MRLFVCFTAMSLAAAGPASALTFEVESTHEGPIAVVSGDFLPTDDFADFERLVRDSGTRTVTFDSPGGQIYRAMELGRLIRRLGLETMALRTLECSSACAFAFLGGVGRYAEPGSIGMHRSWLSPDGTLSVEEAVAAVQQVTSDSMSYISEMGADSNLMQLALQYDSSDMRYLSVSEMEQFRVTTMAVEHPTVGADVPREQPASAYEHEHPSTQRASLYEYGTAGQIVRIVAGEVIWSEFDLWRTSKAAYEPAIRAEVKLADRFALRVAITHDADPAFWTGSVATLSFEPSPGVRIRNVEALSRERPGAATRQMLTVHHAAAKPDRGWFRLALQPAATSLDVLDSGELLCFDLVYESSQNASLCLAKGDQGKAVFARTVEQWRARATSGTAGDAPAAVQQPASPASLEPDEAAPLAPQSRESLAQPGIVDWSVPVAQSGRVRHPNGHAPLMPLPGVEWPPLANFDNGTALRILRSEQRWYQVEIGMAVGYMHPSWVFVDQYDAGGFEQALHVQIRSFDNFPEAESFVRSSPIPVVAYLVNNGWYAVVLRDRLEKDRARILADYLKQLGKIPADSFMTYGNIYVRKVCCG